MAASPRRPAGSREPTELEQACLTVRSALSALRMLNRDGNPDLDAAQMRLAAWLAEHDPRWPR